MHVSQIRIFSKAFAAIVLVSLCCVISAPAETPHWHTTIEEASAEAQKSGKPMMIDFWANWCEACKVMDNNVYTDDHFADAIPQFLPVRIDFDKKQATARKYNVLTLPTIVFTDSYGTELFRYSGYIGAKPLAELMHSLPQDVSEFNRLSQILARDKKNFEALEAMGKELRSAGLYLTSNDYLEKALARNGANADAQERQAIMSNMGLNSLDVRDGKRASETFEKCLKEFPNSEKRPDWLFRLAQAYALADRKDKARKILEEVITTYPGTPDSEKAQSLLSSR